MLMMKGKVVENVLRPGQVLYRNICPMCGKASYMPVEEEKLNDYMSGAFIQDALPDGEYNATEREFVKTGYCVNCQKLLFGDSASSDKMISEDELHL